MVGSSVAFDEPDGAAGCGVFAAGASPDGLPAAGDCGVGGAGCVGVGGGACAEARTLSATRTLNAMAHRRDATRSPKKGAQPFVPVTRYDAAESGRWPRSPSHGVTLLASMTMSINRLTRPTRVGAMQRVTITIDDDLAAELERYMAVRGYANRSEAMRDLARSGLQQSSAQAGGLK